ncbi:MAG: hypothetical protein J6S14_09785 [Clostridia bacterium]|nr:hypothetical protein [Clostridia bacterium]
MAIFISFRTLICSDATDPLNTILADYGIYTLVVCQSNGHSLSDKTYNLNSSIPDLSDYTSEPNGALNGVVFAGADTPIFEPTYTVFMMRAPAMSLKRLPSTSGYIVFYNEDGYWLHSANTFSPGGSGAGEFLLRSADNQFQGYASIIPYRYNAYSGDTYQSAAVAIGSIIAQYDNDVISTLDYEIGGRTGNNNLYPTISVNKISYNTSATSAYQRTIAFLNVCKHGAPPTPPGEDPYDEIPESGPAGGGTDPDFTSSDVVDYPVMPSLSAVSTGFISLWAPTEDQMLDLSSFMWNANPLTIEFWKKLLADPMDMIYGLNIIPLELETAGVDTVTVGLISTGIEMNILASQWVELNCGYIDLDETWGAYLDYDPFTKLEIYLPYCGTHPLKVDDFMPGRISLMYHIDVLTGSCVALIKSTKTDKHGDVVDSVMYQFMGNCATQIPVTAAQYADAVRSVISLAASVGSLIAGPGAGAAMTSTTSNFERGPKGRMRLQSKTVTEKTSSPRDDGASVGSSTIDAVMGMKPGIERSGAIGASGGLLSVQTPYLILTRPRQARPADQNKYTGYPSFITENLGDLEGLTIVKAIHMNNMSCTTEELSEIEDLLRNGVIF